MAPAIVRATSAKYKIRRPVGGASITALAGRSSIAFISSVYGYSSIAGISGVDNLGVGNSGVDMAAKALWYVGKKRAELRDEAVAAPANGELRVRARFGAISRGTERLIFEGRVPESEFERMRAPFM